MATRFHRNAARDTRKQDAGIFNKARGKLGRPFGFRNYAQGKPGHLQRHAPRTSQAEHGQLLTGVSTGTGPITWMPTTTTTTCFPTTYIPTLPVYPYPGPAIAQDSTEDWSEEIARLKRELAIVKADRDELLGCLHPEELL